VARPFIGDAPRIVPCIAMNVGMLRCDVV